MNLKHALLFTASIFAPNIVLGQTEIAGRDQYPQFRVLSGLPGGGFGVLPNGQPSISGAFALATPIGYSMGAGNYAVGFFNTSATLNPTLLSLGTREARSNGTITGMFGSSYRGFHLTVGGSILSSRGDNVLNMQLSPPQRGRVGFAVGVQDAFTTGGANGEPLDFTVGGLSRSYYVVATYDGGRGTYLTVGKGERRFEGVFGSVSTKICDRLHAMIEFDGFNFNEGVLFNFARPDISMIRRRAQVNLFLGVVRQKYGTAGLSISF